MGQTTKLLTASISGIIVGVVSAVFMSGLVGTHRPNLSSSMNIEHWATDWAIGSKASSPYMRAYIARRGLLGLPKSEAVYFIRTVDNDGAPLKETCTYILSGGPQKAMWWSITLYDNKDLLPRNTDGAYSLDQSRLGDGSWSAEITPTQSDNDIAWLSSKNAGSFDIMMRLYKPSPSLLAAPEENFSPPSVKKIHCQGGAQ